MIRMAELERIYVIPLRGAYEGIRTKRSRKAIKIIRSFIAKHMKAELEDVIISQAVNSAIWKRGIQKPPRKIKIKAIKSGEKVSVMLLDEKELPKEEPKPAKKEEKPKAETPAPKTEEPAPLKEEVVEKVTEKVEVTTVPQVKEKPEPVAKKPKEEPKVEEKKE